MAVTETMHVSWFERLGSVFKGIIIGFILIAVGIGLLFWNEGRTIKRYKDLKEGESNVVLSSSDLVHAENEGKLVYMTGKATTEETLTDDEFNVSVNAIKLARDVQMYQWYEESDSHTQRNLGGSEETVTTYTYKKDWYGQVVDSTSFKESGHDNPSSMAYTSNAWTASNVTLGAYRMSSSLVGKMNSFSQFPIKAEPASPAPAAPTAPEAAPAVPAANPAAPAVPTTPVDAPVSQPVGADAATATSEPAIPAPTDPAKASEQNDRKVYQNGYYIGKDPAKPEIGDLKISFRVVVPMEVSIVSQQQGDTFVPYQAKNGTVELLDSGIVSCQQMFAQAQSQNKFMAWILRAIGFILILVGFNMIFAPLKVLADVIPFLGSLVGMGTGFVSFILAGSVSLITISIGWLSYRPFIGVPLLILAIAALVWLFMKGKSAK